MRSISGLGVALTAVFGCLLLALVAELYYLLWWKKRILTKYGENAAQIPSHFFRCWKSPNSTVQHLCNSSPNLVHEPQWLKHDNSMEYFPRFLFTIAEETREDLESEDGGGFRNRKNSSLSSDLILHTPFLTPPASPPYFTPPLTPSFADYQNSPFFESEKDAEFNRLRCSPPPKLKFLRDAEEKLVVQARKVGENGENGLFITLDIDGDGNCRNR